MINPPTITASEQQSIMAASDARLRTIFSDDALVWIVGEEYDVNGPVWRVTLVCQGLMSRWMRRRYRYDIPSDTLHFAGEQPISADDLRTARQSGRRLAM